jgi:lysophospholipid acyltransferase (LPLAT)-like uncharacterized protein
LRVQRERAWDASPFCGHGGARRGAVARQGQKSDICLVLKALLRSPPVQAVLAWLIATYMMLVRRTTRWTYVGLEHAEPIWRSGEGVVWCYWHSRILGAHSIWPRDVQPMLMLISLSPDGQFVAKAAQMVGRRVVRGSSAKKGKDKDSGALSAFRQMIAHARLHGCVGVTPDGPRGPRMRAQEGAVRVAQATGAPLLPSAYSVRGARYARSWDRFLIPPLFSDGVIVFGAPIRPQRSDDPGAVARALEEALTAVTQEADQRMGGPLIAPAPPA